jgi:hypothetical protein
MKNEVKFQEYMTALGEIHGKIISGLLSDVYWKTLLPFDDEECEKAFKDLIFTAKFFPKPADFLDLLRGKKQDQAALAWVEVVKAVKHIGPYQSVSFSDPAINSTIDAMGGWIRLGDMHEIEEKWKAKEFERLYPIMVQRGKHPVKLIGIFERDNGANGYDAIPETVLIGYDERKQIAGSN